MTLARFYSGDSSVLKNKSEEAGNIYFITDTQEIVVDIPGGDRTLFGKTEDLQEITDEEVDDIFRKYGFVEKGEAEDIEVLWSNILDKPFEEINTLNGFLEVDEDSRLNFNAEDFTKTEGSLGLVPRLDQDGTETTKFLRGDGEWVEVEIPEIDLADYYTQEETTKAIEEAIDNILEEIEIDKLKETVSKQQALIEELQQSLETIKNTYVKQADMVAIDEAAIDKLKKEMS